VHNIGRFKQGANPMKAVIYEDFGAPPQLKNVPDPTPEVHGVVTKVKFAECAPISVEIR